MVVSNACLKHPHERGVDEPTLLWGERKWLRIGQLTGDTAREFLSGRAARGEDEEGSVPLDR